MLTKMSVEDWEAQFKPVVNQLSDNPSWQNDKGEGIMFETYGDELRFVKEHYLKGQVWSYVDWDGGTAIVSGMWNSPIGYFVTEVSSVDFGSKYVQELFVLVSEGSV